MSDEDFIKELEKSLIECFEYGKTAVGHNPPLIEYRRLKHLLAERDASRDQQIALAARIDECRLLKSSIEYNENGQNKVINSRIKHLKQAQENQDD